MSRSTRTISLLATIQSSDDEKQKQRLAWEVVGLNDAAATWLARRFCPHPDEDDVSEARLSLYDAALYCDPKKGSSYISVACWYYMRRTTGKRNAAGIHVPANLAQMTSKIRAWMKQEQEHTGQTPSLDDAIGYFGLTLSPEDLHVAMWAVGNPKADRSVRLDSLNSDEEPGTSWNYQVPAEIPDGEMQPDIERLKKALTKLNEFEREAVLTYGGEMPPLREIGEQHGVSREWVNQTRKRVISQLRYTLRVPNAADLNDDM
jgi:RNA polymerase sigma factor (sigma-70 family)